MNQKNEYDYRISVIRIIAMIMIFLCHLVQVASNSLLMQTAQFFNVGVFIFLFISGYLSGGKRICTDNNNQIDAKVCRDWMLRRIKRIFVPLYVFLIIDIVILYINYEKVSIEVITPYLFNMQGVFKGILGTKHLWFLTAIMFCYFITPFLEYYRDNFFIDKIKVNVLYAISFIGIQILCALLGKYKVSNYLIYIGIYSIGYFFKSIDFLNIKKIYLRLTTCMVISMIVRLGGKILWDETILYDSFIVMYTQCVLAIWIAYALYRITDKSHTIDDKTMKIIKAIDGVSMEVYIIHPMFMGPPFSAMTVVGISEKLFGIENFLIDTVFIIILTVICSIILKGMCKFVRRFIEAISAKFAMKSLIM